MSDSSSEPQLSLHELRKRFLDRVRQLCDLDGAYPFDSHFGKFFNGSYALLRALYHHVCNGGCDRSVALSYVAPVDLNPIAVKFAKTKDVIAHMRSVTELNERKASLFGFPVASAREQSTIDVGAHIRASLARVCWMVRLNQMLQAASVEASNNSYFMELDHHGDFDAISVTIGALPPDTTTSAYLAWVDYMQVRFGTPNSIFVQCPGEYGVVVQKLWRTVLKSEARIENLSKMIADAFRNVETDFDLRQEQLFAIEMWKNERAEEYTLLNTLRLDVGRNMTRFFEQSLYAIGFTSTARTHQGRRVYELRFATGAVPSDVTGVDDVFRYLAQRIITASTAKLVTALKERGFLGHTLLCHTSDVFHNAASVHDMLKTNNALREPLRMTAMGDALTCLEEARRCFNRNASVTHDDEILARVLFDAHVAPNEFPIERLCDWRSSVIVPPCKKTVHSVIRALTTYESTLQVVINSHTRGVFPWDRLLWRHAKLSAATTPEESEEKFIRLLNKCLDHAKTPVAVIMQMQTHILVNAREAALAARQYRKKPGRPLFENAFASEDLLLILLDQLSVADVTSVMCSCRFFSTSDLMAVRIPYLVTNGPSRVEGQCVTESVIQKKRLLSVEIHLGAVNASGNGRSARKLLFAPAGFERLRFSDYFYIETVEAITRLHFDAPGYPAVTTASRQPPLRFGAESRGDKQSGRVAAFDSLYDVEVNVVVRPTVVSTQFGTNRFTHTYAHAVDTATADKLNEARAMRDRNARIQHFVLVTTVSGITKHNTQRTMTTRSAPFVIVHDAARFKSSEFVGQPGRKRKVSA